MWIYCYRSSICAVELQANTFSYVNMLINLAMKFSSQATFFFLSPKRTVRLSSGATRNSCIFSTSYKSPFQRASQIKAIQLWSQRKHWGNRSVQSHRDTAWTTCKQRGGLKPKRTRCTKCFLSLSVWWGSPTDRGQAKTAEDRARCTGCVRQSPKRKHVSWSISSVYFLCSLQTHYFTQLKNRWVWLISLI